MSNASLARRRATAQAKAAERLQTIEYVVAGDTLIIASATTVGKLYQVSATECTCDAGRNGMPCWHAEAQLQVMMPAPKPHRTDEQHAALLAELDELGWEFPWAQQRREAPQLPGIVVGGYCDAERCIPVQRLVFQITTVKRQMDARISCKYFTRQP